MQTTRVCTRSKRYCAPLFYGKVAGQPVADDRGVMELRDIRTTRVSASLDARRCVRNSRRYLGCVENKIRIWYIFDGGDGVSTMTIVTDVCGRRGCHGEAPLIFPRRSSSRVIAASDNEDIRARLQLLSAPYPLRSYRYRKSVVGYQTLSAGIRFTCVTLCVMYVCVCVFVCTRRT